MKPSVTLLLTGVLAVAAGSARALEYVSVATGPAILYDAPSTKAKKLFVLSRYMPLEQVVNLGGWVKVRDSSGSLTWIEKSALSSQRYVLVTVPLADVHQAAEVSAPVVFQARQQVALEWLESTGTGWIKVRLQDGVTGYVGKLDVWGD